ncbi:MAG TPA: fatty acid desaturase [Gammaproteobacteria bacterium]|nr:fatty acid desaturase [Gammaproteobacteria bacterium]
MIDFISNGLLNVSGWTIVLFTLIATHITVAGVTLYLHRDATHRGLDLHPVVRHFFRFWLWMTTAMNTKEWVAIHRKHHAKCETEEDPHSPQILGLKKVLFEGAELYRAEAANQETLEKFGRGTPDDWVERNVYSRFPILGVSIMLVIDVLMFGAIGLTVWALQMINIPLLAAGVINGVGHYYGYRNFECKDAATNVMPWGVIMGGEELHNNHHAYPSSAKFALRRGEFDIGWLYIRTLSALGLARVRRVAPTPAIDAERRQLDLETVKAIIVARLHVLRDYAAHVTLPTLRDEMASAGRKVRALFVREVSLLDEKARQNLNLLLEKNERLKTVHEFRERLQKLWESSTLSNEKLVESFKNWCEEAEKSGVEALERFAQRLRGYRLQGLSPA